MMKITSKDGTAIAYDRSGQGPALILVGGAFQFRAIDPKTAQLAGLLANPEMIREFAGRAAARAQALYCWERVADQYERLFAEMTGIEVGHAAPAAPEMESAA